MWKSNDNITTLIMLKKKGLSLVELIVVTVVIAIAATLAFPTYTIFQQRSKEKRLKKILTDVRAAINGTKSHNSTNTFEEGFRTLARVKGIEEILKIASESAEPWSLKARQDCINIFITQIGQGYGYPNSPNDIWAFSPKAIFKDSIEIWDEENTCAHHFKIGNGTGLINLERRFYRSQPVHPFHDWYPTADFAFVPVVDTNDIGSRTYTLEEWFNPTYNPGLKGVKDIVSRGAGLALDGSNTDDW